MGRGKTVNIPLLVLYVRRRKARSLTLPARLTRTVVRVNLHTRGEYRNDEILMKLETSYPLDSLVDARSP